MIQAMDYSQKSSYFKPNIKNNQDRYPVYSYFNDKFIKIMYYIALINFIILIIINIFIKY